MAFAGYLMKFTQNNETVPYDFIQTFKSTPNQRTDMDDYPDANGELHRNVLSHTSTKTEWTTPPMSISKWEELMALFKRNYINELERKVPVEYYNFESCDYKTGYFYIPDFTVEALLVRRNNDLLINSVRLAIIEY